jgi:hypothetical protein
MELFPIVCIFVLSSWKDDRVLEKRNTYFYVPTENSMINLVVLNYLVIFSTICDLSFKILEHRNSCMCVCLCVMKK